MRIKFIGTGSGKSSLKRYHSSFLISSGKHNLLVDAGDGVSRALLKQNVTYNSLDGILLTHLHPDHYSGLASLLVQMKLHKRENPLKIVVHKSLIQTIKNFILQSYLFPDKLKFEVTFGEFEYDEFYHMDENFGFLPRQNSHLDDNISYASDAGISTSCSSFLFNLDNRYLFYTSDIGGKDDLYIFNDFSIDVMVTEITHVGFDEIFEALKFLNPKRLFFTHISEENEPGLIRLYDNLPEELKSKIIPAVDGMIIEV
ncbi:MAG: MBL fold metallo-hydrolase [Ignavibacteriaceae bacterium]